MVIQWRDNKPQRTDYDEFGRITFQETYDTDGETPVENIPDLIPFGFAGGLYDPDTKLVHFGAREYDPETGRWTSKDPILFWGGDTNLYGYVMGDPVNWVDTNGMAIDVCLDIGFIGWDLYNLYGDPSAENFTALGLDIVGAALPFATGLGMVYKLGKEAKQAERAIKQAEKELRTNPQFRNWLHREFKTKGGGTPGGGRKNPNLTGEELADALEEWLESGGK